MEQTPQNNGNIEKITVGEAEANFINKVTQQSAQEEPKQEPVVDNIEPIPTPQPKTETTVKKESIEEEPIDGLVTNNVDPDLEVRHISGKKTEESKIKDPNYVGEIYYPSTTFQGYLDYYSKLPQTEEEMNGYIKKLPDEMAAAIALNTVSDRATILNGVLADNINNPENDYVNSIEFGGKKLLTRPIDIKTNTKLTQESAIARIHAMLGVGEVIQVPLWHSGFWVTLKPIKQKDFVNLYTALTASSVKLGRETNSLIYSNYSVVFTRIMTEFILANITEHTLKLNDDESLLDYIKVQDLYPLANGLISAIYPKGLDIVKCCVNTTKVDPKTNEPLCDYSVAAKVDSKKLLWVNRRALDKYMVTQMCKRTAGSVSTSEALEYQQRIKRNATEVVTKSETGVTVKFGLKMPNLRDYITYGEKWVNDLIADTEKLYTPQDTDQDKVSKLSDAITLSRLSTYNAYIEKVTFVDNNGVETCFDKPETVKEALDTISNDQTLFDSILNDIGKFFTNGTIAIIATPNFICPKCKASQEEIETSKPFKEFIPLNVIENFFALGGLRKDAITKTGLW